ncbi:Uma2 family endonuclease [Dyadobacter pollutisoli]|jgi:Uma2 family endonuclease|uniref:Uma2 family endonuclease n=1 Tax=Dyadobacter pollutisoli TaxID=2910158 RepID=A0A9E8SJX7_9BACT|nr:Uma2 family endonuclease [Dyadobacter pollutisoli]WAC11343.1 Uma2 family endonuclease [Dyadobacter pollutisoli]
MMIPLNMPVHKFLNDEELIAFSVANPELSIERDEEGQLFINMTPAFAISSSNNSELITELGIWNRKYKAGRVLESNGGFFLADSSMRLPDVAWIKLERWDALSMSEKKSFPHLAPDFVIELKSETDGVADLQSKMSKWIENGVRLAWLICTDQQMTYIFEPGKPTFTMKFEETLSGGTVLNHFSVRLSDILEY